MSHIDNNHEDLVKILNKYQDKGGLDRRRLPIFISTCQLLDIYLTNPTHVTVSPKMVVFKTAPKN